MEGQISIFDYLKEKQKVKPCECGNTKLAIRYAGCGIPNQFSPVVTYDNYLFCVFCPKCYRVAMSGDYECAWRSNKLSIKDAIKDWNTYKHRLEYDKRLGKYGHDYYASIMTETIERFLEAKEVCTG